MDISERTKGWFSIILAITAAGYFHFRGPCLTSSQLSQIAQTLASASGTILGFLITAIALMASVMDRSLLANLRATGGYQVLIKRFFVCAALHLCLLTVSIALLFPFNSDLLLVFAVFFATGATTYLVSAGWGFYRVIKAMSKSV